MSTQLEQFTTLSILTTVIVSALLFVAILLAVVVATCAKSARRRLDGRLALQDLTKLVSAIRGEPRNSSGRSLEHSTVNGD